MARTKILGVAYGGGHANIVIPVLKELERRGYETLLLALTSAGPQAERASVKYKGFRHYTHLLDRVRVAEAGEPLARQMHNAELGIPLDESIFYLGVNVLENEERLGAVLANEVWERVGRQGFLPVEFMKKVISFEACDVVVTTNAPRTEAASLIAAHLLGVKSVRIEDLYGVPIVFDTQTRKLGMKRYKQSAGRFKYRPTLMCFLSEFSRDNFIERQRQWNIEGIRPQDTMITGQPVFADIDRVTKARPEFGLIPGRESFPTVVWAHENGHADNDEVLQLVSRWHDKSSDGFNLIVKVRPNLSRRDRDDLTRKFRAGSGNLRVIHGEMNPNQVLWNSHVTLGQESTMLTQAAYMGRPIIVIDPDGLRGLNPLVVKGVAPAARNLIDLTTSIESLVDLESDQFASFVAGRASMGYVTDGVNNVATAIEGMIRGGPKPI